MDHSKYIPFMLQCDKCSRGWSINSTDFEKSHIECQNPECDNRFSVYEGIKTGLKSNDDFIPKTFIASDIFKEIINVKLGYSVYVNLPPSIKKVQKVNLFPFSEGSYIIGSTELDENGFRLLTSLTEDTSSEDIGKDINVLVMVHAKVEDYQESWLHLLSYALEQYNSGDFMTSVLLSEISLETYVDTTLSQGYRNKNLDDDSISRFIEATNMPVKVNSLMNNLYGIKLATMSNYNNWEKKVLKMRNLIAHGRKTDVTKEDAKFAFDTIIDAIFHLVEGVDSFIKNK